MGPRFIGPRLLSRSFIVLVVTVACLLAGCHSGRLGHSVGGATEVTTQTRISGQARASVGATTVQESSDGQGSIWRAGAALGAGWLDGAHVIGHVTPVRGGLIQFSHPFGWRVELVPSVFLDGRESIEHVAKAQLAVQFGLLFPINRWGPDYDGSATLLDTALEVGMRTEFEPGAQFPFEVFFALELSRFVLTWWGPPNRECCTDSGPPNQ